MRRKLGIFLTIAGAAVLIFAIMQYAEHQMNIKKALAEADALIRQSDREGTADKVSASQRGKASSLSDRLADRKAFKPKPNDIIGMLQIPKLKAELPIIEGTDEEMLKKGVGHYSTTAFPMDNEQILLSGHRETVFRNFDKLALGDRFVVKLPYGTFEYEIKSTDIVDKNDTSVIRSMGTEALVVSTCYPFRYVGDAPERYILYAYPVEDNKNF
ncbi:class D sortase [Paenibacillus sp. DMB20]|uniref:class D sortase n=1 Tax=Paenibacillus sp. DMB20 TaxID=1642570 RepID=UPI000628107A|nr:class D sortase [Paenibacillus sp. DMB20]KKO52840.1 sortase [Paenibacillus sp. DMB20]